MAHKSLKEEVALLTRRQGGFEEECLSLSLHLGLGSPTHVQPSTGACLQLQNGYIYMSCAGQHDGQGLRLGLPPFTNNNSNEKGTHHKLIRAISEEDIDLRLCLSTQISPHNHIELRSEDGMKLNKQILLYKESENDVSNKVMHDDIKSISSSASSASSNTFPNEGRNTEVDSYLKNTDLHHHKQMKEDGSVGGKEMQDYNIVGGREMKEDIRVNGGKEMHSLVGRREMKDDSRIGGKGMQEYSIVGGREMKEDFRVGGKEMKEDSNVGGQEMMTMGCAHCFLYVLMCKDEPKCPKCGSSALLNLRAPIHNQHNICKKRRREETSVPFNEDNKSDLTSNVVVQH